MKKFSVLLLFAALMATNASASDTRTLDGAQITNGAATLTLPTSTDTMLGRNTTDTLTNKSLSGASNTFTNIPTSAVSSGQLAVANGGTGLSTVATNAILFGSGTSPLGVAAAGTQYQVFRAGASGVPAFGAVNLDQSVAVTGTLPVANGGTGAATLTANNVLLGNGTSAVLFVAPGTSGNVLTSNGTTWTSASAPTAPSLNGTSASPQSIVAATGISLSSITYSNIVWVVGDSGAVTVTATPSITAGTANGQRLLVIGTSNTNTVTLQDEAGLTGSALRLNGSWVGAKYSILELVWDHNASEWDEISRR